MSGCKAPRFNAFMFFTIFIRFVEMIFVFIYMEEEALKRMKSKARTCRENFSSTATSYSNLSVVIPDENLDQVVCADGNPSESETIGQH